MDCKAKFLVSLILDAEWEYQHSSRNVAKEIPHLLTQRGERTRDHSRTSCSQTQLTEIFKNCPPPHTEQCQHLETKRSLHILLGDSSYPKHSTHWSWISTTWCNFTYWFLANFWNAHGIGEMTQYLSAYYSSRTWVELPTRSNIEWLKLTGIKAQNCKVLDERACNEKWRRHKVKKKAIPGNKRPCISWCLMPRKFINIYYCRE